MRHPWIIYWAIAVHTAWGIALMIDPSVTAAVILIGFHWIVSAGVAGPVLGAFLVFASAIALSSLLAGRRLGNTTAFLLLMPQYALLVAAFISDAESVITSVLPDGRQIDRLVLFTVLWPTMVAALLHSLAIIERHTQWNRL